MSTGDPLGPDRLGPYDEAPYGCPTCRTILNAKKAGCADLWHSDNRPEPVGSTPVSEEPARPPTDEHDRYLIGCSLIQSGYIDQDDDAPDWFDLVQWHHCFVEPNCQGPTCFGCSGVPFISDEVWREMGKAVDKIREEAYARGISEGRQEIDSLKHRIAEYENAITWNVSCFGCAKQLDGLIAERAAGYEEGLADGRRQATEGWEREWGVHDRESFVFREEDEDEAHRLAALVRGAEPVADVVSRLVGPWEPAEQLGVPIEGDRRRGDR